jgi:hypothetical protein
MARIAATAISAQKVWFPSTARRRTLRDMAIHRARRIGTTLEPLHDVVYFGAGTKEAEVEIGLRGFGTYFAFRAAPLGPANTGTVMA